MNLSTPSLSIFVYLLRRIPAFLVFVVFLASPSMLHAATATWNANTEPNIAGYILSYGQQSGQHNIVLDVGNVTTAQVALTPGTRYYFVVQAYNTSAQVSVKSAEVIYDAPVGSNRAPVLTPPPNQSHAENAAVSLQLLANDPDGNALSYSATGLPAALNVSPTTGLISGTLTSTSSGTYSVTATASDGALTDSKTFTWTVTDVVAGPTITSLSRTSGSVGTAVNIIGTNFGATPGGSSVRFNGTVATPANWSATNIGVQVPSGATTGPVTVTVGGVASNGITFTVNSTQGPTITSLSRTSGSVGTAVTITGTNFGATPGGSSVRFNGTVASPNSWSATSIAVQVPSGATTGPVTVTVGGVASNGVTFTVGSAQAPSITNLSPTSGVIGAAVTLTGANFGSTQGTSTVRFNGTVATVTSWSTGLVGVLVPNGATTGPVTVTVGGVASNGITFTINSAQGPSITSLSRTSGPVGTAVTITGTNFGATPGGSSVRFNGRAATPTSWSATSIGVQVPSGATTGPVTVTVGGIASNGINFTVNSGTGTITLIQSRGVQSSGMSISLPFTSNNAAGNLIVVAVRAALTTQTINVADARGNVYRQAVRLNVGTDHALAIYYAENIRAGANGVVVSLSTAASLRYAIFEYAGAATANALDVAASATQSSATPSSNATTTASGDLLVGAFSTRTPRTFAAGSGYTMRQAIAAAPSTALMVEDRIQATAGPIAANASLNSAEMWGAALASFRSGTGGASGAPAMMQTDLAPLAAPAAGDFDGDGTADITVFRPATGNWSSLTSSTNFTAATATPWGEPTDILVPGDYDGDRKADVAMFRPATGMWHILKSTASNAESATYVWGENGDVPVPADYDGDGKTDLAVFRPSSGLWYILTSGTNYTASATYTWGGISDRPIAGDYDGDQRADLAVYRASTGTWEILQSTTGYRGSLRLTLGSSTDVIVPGDYDGDGKTDAAVFQPSTGIWSILKSSTNFAGPAATVSWGQAGDTAVAADYDGDGHTDITVFSATTGGWYILKSSSDYSAYMTFTWGSGGDRPLPAGR